jgi:hypothetical protein
MFENICMMQKIRVDVDAMSAHCANEMSGLRGKVMIMAMTCKKESALYSPTSALEKKRLLSRLGEEVGGTEESFLTDSDKLIVQRL